MSGSDGSGAGARSSRWKVPPPVCAARSAVIAETMLPAAPVTTYVPPDGSRLDDAGSTSHSTSPTVQRKPSEWPISTAPGSRSVSSINSSASAAVLRLRSKSTTLTSASPRSSASALQKPLTAPPMTDVAPCSS